MVSARSVLTKRRVSARSRLNPYHPFAMMAARRSARRLSAPTTIGGQGRCTGRDERFWTADRVVPWGTWRPHSRRRRAIGDFRPFAGGPRRSSRLPPAPGVAVELPRQQDLCDVIAVVRGCAHQQARQGILPAIRSCEGFGVDLKDRGAQVFVQLPHADNRTAEAGGGPTGGRPSLARPRTPAANT